MIAAAAGACDAVAAKLSRDAKQAEAGDASVDLRQRADEYRKRAEELRDRAAVFSGKPLMPARSVDEKESAEEDEDRVSPSFRRGIHDNPRE